jgi:hypothetical protein
MENVSTAREIACHAKVAHIAFCAKKEGIWLMDLAKQTCLIILPSFLHQSSAVS